MKPNAVVLVCIMLGGILSVVSCTGKPLVQVRMEPSSEELMSDYETYLNGVLLGKTEQDIRKLCGEPKSIVSSSKIAPADQLSEQQKERMFGSEYRYQWFRIVFDYNYKVVKVKAEKFDHKATPLSVVPEN